MPIEYQRDDRRHLITVTVTEPFSFDELVDQTDRQWTEHTWEYAILYDVRATVHDAPADELQQLTDRVRVIGAGHPRGPMGMVIPARPERFRGGLQLARLSAGLMEVEILLNRAQVEAWLTRHAPCRGSPAQS
jgi:hypothetical protein